MAKNFDLIAKKIRSNFLKLLQNGHKYHLGGTASCVDILVAIFYGGFINLKNLNREKFILSKGHALGALHVILIDQKILTKKNFLNLKKNNKIGGQLDIFNLNKYVDWNTGSLGHSIGVVTGFALASPKKKFWTLIGDAEVEEGSVWEGIFFLSEQKIKNVIIIIDRNKISASKKIDYKEIFDIKLLDKLNLNIYRINGHKFEEIFETLKLAKKSNKSSIIIAETIKGKGFGIAENNINYSHQIPNKTELKKMIKKYAN